MFLNCFQPFPVGVDFQRGWGGEILLFMHVIKNDTLLSRL